MAEPMKCGGWSFPTIGCGTPIFAERYSRDPVVDHDTMIRCLDAGAVRLAGLLNRPCSIRKKKVPA